MTRPGKKHKQNFEVRPQYPLDLGHIFPDDFDRFRSAAGRRLFRKSVVRYSHWKPGEPWKPQHEILKANPKFSLTGLPNTNAKSQRFSYVISQISTLPPVVALNRCFKSQLQLDMLRFGTQFPKSHWPLSFKAPKSQRFKSQRLQDANATKSQTLAFYKSQRFSASKPSQILHIPLFLRKPREPWKP